MRADKIRAEEERFGCKREAGRREIYTGHLGTPLSSLKETTLTFVLGLLREWSGSGQGVVRDWFKWCWEWSGSAPRALGDENLTFP